MKWNMLLTGESLSNWINNLIPDPASKPTAKFSKGPALDPFETSLRVTKKYTEHLSNIENGVEIKAQNYVDLTKSGILTRIDDGYEISSLGANVLSKWRKIGLDNESDDDEFYRVIILILEARKLNIKQYLEMLSFWKEINSVASSLQFIANPTSLYLLGVLNQEISGFNPWRLIKDNNLEFDPVNTINQLKQAFKNKPDVISRIERIESIWQKDFRPKGRQIFCLAMDCIVSEKSIAELNLKSNEASSLIGNFTQENLETCISWYAIGNVGKNIIFYGPPGTGKSFEAEGRIKGWDRETVIFHPAFDYSAFVGHYKPISKYNSKHEKHEVIYSYAPQSFMRLYVAAWLNLFKPHCLLIEEINRGSCAQIFGDVFQLLDRDNEGFSKYFISLDNDIESYLEKELEGSSYSETIKKMYMDKNGIELENPYSVMLLPGNLSIYATMNTSDQSLFPMDSAFKRRWEWKYIPIDYTTSDKVVLDIDGDRYDWTSFLKIINRKILAITESEDKQIGNYFVNPKDGVIKEELFVNKVMFYLWSDIFKEEDQMDENYVFSRSGEDGTRIGVSYSDLFSGNIENTEVVKSILEFNSVSRML